MKHRVRVEIDLAALKRNYGRIVRHVAPAEVLCVLKADAYGLGVRQYARSLVTAGCRRFGVAEPFEAMALLRILKQMRSAGDGVRVQILSSVLPDEIEEMVFSEIVLPVVCMESAGKKRRCISRSIPAWGGWGFRPKMRCARSKR